MKPSRTAHILRSVLRELRSPIQVDPAGVLLSKPAFPDPTTFKSPAAFAAAYQAYNVARKRKVKATPKQMSASLQKWADAEGTCRVINLHQKRYSPLTREDRDLFSSLQQRTSRIISYVLSDVWPRFEFNPTGGATNELPKKFCHPATKVTGTPVVSWHLNHHKCAPAAQDLLVCMFDENPGFARRFDQNRWKYLDEFGDTSPVDTEALAEFYCQAYPPAVLDFVSKDNETVRIIAKSGSLSIMVQKIFGDAIRHALLERVGVDLNDQTINQEWAEIGSLTGLIATVDMTSASDSIALGHLRYFPRRWQEYFLSCRDTHVKPRQAKRAHTLNMVAGMGNGYIFELESLLFYAMARSVVEELGLDVDFVNVYGDDIIIPSRAYDVLTKFFEYEGFTVNPNKSFATGPFRESCGKHFFNGVDVTPIYVRGDLNEVHDMYHCFNGLSEWSHRTGVPLRRSIALILQHISPKHRHIVPPTWGSRAGLWYDCPGAIHPMVRWNKRYQREEWVWRVMRPKMLDVSERFGDYFLLMAWLCAAEGKTKVLSNEVYSYVCSRLSHFVFSRHGSFEEYVKGKIEGGSPQYKWALHRDVSPLGDAFRLPQNEQHI